MTFVAVASLALGIGANTAIFSLVNGLVLRELPIAGRERLVTITTTTAVEKNWRWTWNYQLWSQIRQRSGLFDGTLAFAFDRFNTSTSGEAEFVDGLWVDSALFSTASIAPVLGRTFAVRDDSEGVGAEGPVAVISYTFWERRFGRSPDVTGRTLTLEGQRFTIIGVLPRWFSGLEVDRTFDVAVPLSAGPLLRGRQMEFDGRGQASLTVMARLKPNETSAATLSALRAVQLDIWNATLSRNARPEYRQSYLTQSFAFAPGTRGESNGRRSYERPLLTILGVVVLLLLVACMNVANLLLARGEARRYEMAIRRALGAS